jgi:hypothetical protein
MTDKRERQAPANAKAAAEPMASARVNEARPTP